MNELIWSSGERVNYERVISATGELNRRLRARLGLKRTLWDPPWSFIKENQLVASNRQLAEAEEEEEGEEGEEKQGEEYDCSVTELITNHYPIIIVTEAGSGRLTKRITSGGAEEEEEVEGGGGGGVWF